MTAAPARSLAGRTAVVTGSGRRRGLGEAIARRLAAEGAAVVLSDIGRSVDLADMNARIPLGRAGLVEDTANAVAFLCSAQADYITAESLNVSGGEEPH